MHFWTLANEREKWENMFPYLSSYKESAEMMEYWKEMGLSSNRRTNVLTYEEYSDDSGAPEWVEDYVCRIDYKWTSEDDDYDTCNSGSGTKYKELDLDNIVVCDCEVVGIMLVQTVHYHMSNSTTLNGGILFFDKADKEKGEKWNDYVTFSGSHCGSHTTDSGEATFYLVKRSQVPEGEEIHSSTYHLSEPEVR